jgi:hypothetical protein
MEGAIADLLRVVEDAPDVAALAPLDPIRCPSRWACPCDASAPSSSRKSGTMPCSSLLRAVSMLSSSAMRKRHAKTSRRSPKGWPCPCGVARTAKEDEALRARIAPAGELVQQAALAEAGVADHRDGRETDDRRTAA